jgi:hypothetical protein
MTVSGVCPVHRHTARTVRPHPPLLRFLRFFISGEGTMGQGTREDEGRSCVSGFSVFFLLGRMYLPP